MKKKKDGRGGARPGAGRHPVIEKRVAVSFRCPASLKDKIDEAAKKEKMTSAAWVREVCIRCLDKK